MNTMMELRKCCNHPYLIDGAEEGITRDLKEKTGLASLESDMLIDTMVQVGRLCRCRWVGSACAGG